MPVLIAVLLTGCKRAAKEVNPIVTPNSPEAAGMNVERLKRLDNFLRSVADRRWMNGSEALVLHNGKIAYHKSFGFNDIAAKQPMPTDGIFRIASQTKAITSVAVMMLFEEGKVLLDDNISLYIPEFKGQRVMDQFNPKDSSYTTIPAKREVTVRDLLTHTSGIGYSQIGGAREAALYGKNEFLCGLGYEKGRVLGDDIRKLGKIPLLHQPGEKFTYGLNVDVLGYLVEVLSGMSLNDFLQTRIFRPLGMDDTYFYLPDQKQNRLVNLYIADEQGALTKSPGYATINGLKLMDYPKNKGTYYAGGGGLSSTVMDYAVFLQMLLNDGEYNGQRLLSRTTVRMMTTNQIGPLSLESYKFGLGFQIATAESAATLPISEGTYSWGGAFSTTYWVDPKEKIIGILYRQLWDDQHTAEVNQKFQVLVYQALE